ncbi:MAG: hypothetical protein ABSH40_17810 [Bryobacteraceae bacterium]
MHLASNEFSSGAGDFSLRGVLPETAFHVGDHFVNGIEGAKSAAGFDVGQTLSQPGVNDALLLRGIVVVRGNLRAVNHQPGGDDNLAALECKGNQIALGQTGLAPYAGGDGNLAFILDFPCGVHIKAESNSSSRESRPSVSASFQNSSTGNQRKRFRAAVFRAAVSARAPYPPPDDML